MDEYKYYQRYVYAPRGDFEVRHKQLCGRGEQENSDRLGNFKAVPSGLLIVVLNECVLPVITNVVERWTLTVLLVHKFKIA